MFNLLCNIYATQIVELELENTACLNRIVKNSAHLNLNVNGIRRMIPLFRHHFDHLIVLAHLNIVFLYNCDPCTCHVELLFLLFFIILKFI